jgi:DNA-binding LytR/AlgR family response regulator
MKTNFDTSNDFSSLDKISILIIEDEPIIAADLEDRLLEAGYAVLGSVARGEEALDFFDQKPPDLVIMDIQLEGEWDGIETTRRIRQKKDLPVIFLTSNSDDATFRTAAQVNPQAFLSKPFRGRDLIHAIEIAIRQFTKTSDAQDSAVEENDTYLLYDRLFIKVKNRMKRLFFKDILWLEADDYYCKVVTPDSEFLVTKTLKKFSEELMGRPEFMRVHRSYIVNLQHVEEIGELFLYIGKEKIPVSRDMREELLARLKNG